MVASLALSSFSKATLLSVSSLLLALSWASLALISACKVLIVSKCCNSFCFSSSFNFASDSSLAFLAASTFLVSSLFAVMDVSFAFNSFSFSFSASKYSISLRRNSSLILTILASSLMRFFSICASLALSSSTCLLVALVALSSASLSLTWSVCTKPSLCAFSVRSFWSSIALVFISFSSSATLSASSFLDATMVASLLLISALSAWSFARYSSSFCLMMAFVSSSVALSSLSLLSSDSLLFCVSFL